MPQRGYESRATDRAGGLAARCEELLAVDITKLEPENPGELGSSTPAVHRHRGRKEQWLRIAHLFPGVTFRPKHRRRRPSRKKQNSIDATIPLKLCAAEEQ